MKKNAKIEKRMTLELKYCERCGGLWLRPAGGKQIYCVSCARQMAEMLPTSRRLDSSSADQAGSDGFFHEVNESRLEEGFGEFAGGEL
jgi:Zn-finger nucleic acid-binding protein